MQVHFLSLIFLIPKEASPGSPEGYGIPSLADFEKANGLPTVRLILKKMITKIGPNFMHSWKLRWRLFCE